MEFTGLQFFLVHLRSAANNSGGLFKIKSWKTARYLQDVILLVFLSNKVLSLVIAYEILDRRYLVEEIYNRF